MTTFAIAAALAAAYLWYGLTRVAPAYVAREVAAWIEEHPRLAEDPKYIADYRRFEAGFAVLLALVWPFYLAGRALVGRIVQAAPPTDRELREQNKRQADRIAELERELGTGREA